AEQDAEQQHLQDLLLGHRSDDVGRHEIEQELHQIDLQFRILRYLADNGEVGAETRVEDRIDDQTSDDAYASRGEEPGQGDAHDADNAPVAEKNQARPSHRTRPRTASARPIWEIRSAIEESIKGDPPCISSVSS